MGFSKRRPPMDFGAAPAGEPEPLEAAPSEAMVFRPLDPPAVLEPAAPAASPARPPVRAADLELGAKAAAPPAGWPIWLIAFLVSALWALGPIAFALGYRNKVAPLQDDMFALAVFALLAVGPAVFVWGCAYLIRQGQKLAFETRRTETMAQDMLTPAVVAAARAGDVTEAIRDEIARAGAEAEAARETLLALRQALALETEQLTVAAAQSARTAEQLTGALGQERAEMGQLAHTLDAQAARVTDAIASQAKMVAEAAGLAETQIREAETTLSARAADLAAAAAEASDAARTAGEDLTRHIARLETAGAGVSDQVRAVETGLSEQRQALVALSGVLKADHAGFAEQTEQHAQTLSEFITQARLSAAEMSERAAAGGEALRQLMSDAALQFRDLAETARAEREEFGQSTLQSFEAVTSAAAQERAKLEGQTRAAIEALAVAAEETRAAAASHAAAAREQVDQLSEAAFAAGQKANQVFEARLEEARALIEQSSKMVEDAGSATAHKLEEGAVAARATLDELTAMLGEIEARAARLPVAARGQADQVREAVSDGLEALMEQARRTAEQAKAIDAAFQERVRKNFEMLSDAVRLMGVVTAAPADALPAEATPASRPAREPAVAAAEEPEPLELDELADPGEAAGGPLAAELGLRQRLRLTPTASDAEFSKVFEAAGGRTPEPADDEEDAETGGETWTWKDLLASLDGADGEGERLEAQLSAELDRMGVDPAKLLPKARVEEIAAAMQTGDVEGVREVVRKLAPAACRRIARRLFTDEDVKRKTEVYVRRYKTLVDDAAVRDPEGFGLAHLLLGQPGRLFLLLDAAAGDGG